MSSGKIIAGAVLLCAILAGGALYYLQIFGYYTRLQSNDVTVQLTTKDGVGTRNPLEIRQAQAITADSSPIRYRACFDTDLTSTKALDRFEPYKGASPLVAPFWFSCFDAKALGRDLENNQAIAFLGTENITYGIDEIVVLYPDGRGYAWRQINSCGAVVFKGKPVPDSCPPVAGKNK